MFEGDDVRAEVTQKVAKQIGELEHHETVVGKDHSVDKV